MFQHFIITPFNVDVGLKARSELLDCGYLRRRFKLFQEFCFPSVYNQTNQNFKWLAFFDYETPDEIKEKIKSLQKWSNFIPIFTQENMDFKPFLVKIIHQYLKPEDTHIITTWLDGDDAIANDFIEQVQQQFNHQSFEYINFFYGYQLTKDGLFFQKYLANQFLSLIEQIDDNILTCKIMRHVDIDPLSKEGLPVRQVVTSPLWIQLIHEDNVLSKLYYQAIPQPLGKLKQDFSVQNFVSNFSNDLYIYNCKNYLKYLFSKVFKSKILIQTFLGNLILLMNPKFLITYYQKKFEQEYSIIMSHQLSILEMKTLCLQQKSIWRKSGNITQE
ncbi:MAG: hypothetical protein F6K18_04480 [Okeania sp. SIO2C2]|uniref:glycosyltransferase n=1 Tax=Okeania sp. SIO2C2 TaxID=2607787 RepID=UPI0013BAFC42|nr:glycosyltransferase [Okeania sp. SIO2C2]NEP86133.1 hypothetical protein [Okeania sp. SIO2C2]